MKEYLFGKRAQRWVLSLLIPMFATTGGPVQANPAGPNVVVGAGHVNFNGLGTARLNIINNTQRAVINWDSFSIQRGEVTRVTQGANAFTLNRVTSGNPSAIYGQLRAVQGGVAVINPNGIVVGPNGVVDVGGRAILSTLDIDNDDFANGGEDRFYGNTNTGVTNFGSISSAEGDVVLMGGFVDNQGQIGALNGTVAIGAGGDIILHEGAGSRISVRGSSDYTGTAIDNSGSIRGANAELKAHGNVYALAINNTGAIRATGADRSSGRVLLRASGGSSNINLGNRSTITARAGSDGGSVAVDAGEGQATVSGKIDATGAATGGVVSVVGNQVEQTAGSVIDASGGQIGGTASLDAAGSISVSGLVLSDSATGQGGQVSVTGQTVLINDGAELSTVGHSAGGTIRVGGDFQGRDTGLREADLVRVETGAILTADSTAGNGGTAIVWANKDTIFTGEISASAVGSSGDGGLVEVSGKQFLYFDGTARVGTVGGEAGTVLFDPGNVVIGVTGTTPPIIGTQPTTDSTISIAAVNDTLQSGANVLVVTSSGNIIISDVGGGGDQVAGTEVNNRHSAIQWTNSLSSFGAFASGSIFVNNHIRTSGAGSINLIGGWGGGESDGTLQFSPQSAWDTYVSTGQFGLGGGSVFVGSGAMARHVEVGSRFGDTNVAGFEIRVTGSDTAGSNRYAMIGFHDSGQNFAPRLDRGVDGGTVQIRLDMKVGAPEGSGAWLLSDGLNTIVPATNQAAAGVGDPIVAVVGNAFGQEVDLNGDGIVDGVRGINSTGLVVESFIPYASHFNSATTGNWWWQQIEATGSAEIKDPTGLGGLRPEHGAGIGALSSTALGLGLSPNGADLNVIARGSVTVQSGNGNEAVSAYIGHGGPNRTAQNGQSYRAIGGEDRSVTTSFSITEIEGNQMERRWSFNGSDNDRVSTSIARLAPVYGNINVFAGINAAAPISINRAGSTTVTATSTNSGNVILRGSQTFEAAAASNSSAQIGHGGIGQFGEYYGDIRVQAGGNVILLAGEATRANATIGHVTTGHAYWNPTSVQDQQVRFFATAGDFDNPNLRRGALFNGVDSTGFDPSQDPEETRRYSLARYTILELVPGTFSVVVTPGNTGNYIPIINASTGVPTGQFRNVHNNSVLDYNPAQYTRGLSNVSGAHLATAGSQGINWLAPLDLSPTGPIQLAALDGSTVTGFHGNITVIAQGGDITLRGFSTEGVAGNNARDSRFASIGHGGRSFAASVGGSGYLNAAVGAPSVPGAGGAAPDGREVITFHIPNGTGLNTGGRSDQGAAGTSLNRSPVFVTVTGDIDVQAGGNLTMVAGNDIYDYTQIGHGGPELTDYETSSYLLGDIRVRVGGNVTLVGGGSVQPINRDGDYDLRAWSIIGHGGYRSGINGFLGDIQVNAGGSVLLRNGAFSWSMAKIGHQTTEDWGQSGGSFIKSEQFLADGVITDILSSVTANAATVTYSAPFGHSQSVVGTRDFTAGGAGTLVGAARNTADITVTAGTGVTLDHLQMGQRQPAERLAWRGVDLTNTAYNVDSQAMGLRTRNSYAQIGHGGGATHTLNWNNTAVNFSAKIGDVTVTTASGDISLKNGEGEQRWTRIGHGVGASNRVADDTNTAGYSRSIDLVGDITVSSARGNVVIDASAADENERIENTNAAFGVAAPSRLNPVAIGHGGIYDNQDLVVLGQGELVKDIAASSDIQVTAGGDLYILGGKGVEASFAQLGHGFTSDLGNDAARRFSVPVGFSGDIDVYTGGDIFVVGGENAWSEQPSGIGDNEGRSVTGAFAAIGHGGYQLDAPSFGNITVFAGRDMGVVAQRRTDPFTDDIGASPYSIQNPTPGFEGVGSAFNFAKVGHFAVENGNRSPDGNDVVQNATQTGDITVVVGRDLNVAGGTTPNIDTQIIFGAFAQIGHGGPAASGDVTGDITVLVKRDLRVAQGTGIEGSSTLVQVNNYAMIGNGDFLKGTNASPSSIFRREGQGFRVGDIIVAAGRNGTFNGALVGHADPAITNQTTFGNLQVAVARLDPFFGGKGDLTATNGTVFSSGASGVGTLTQFFMPARANNKMDATTRINEDVETFMEAPANFAAPFNRANGNLAGREDEVYLTPDLWWDQQRVGAERGFAGGGVFPTDAISGQGGAVALVDNPGGLRNLRALVTGSLGGSATIYRDGNSVSGDGLYTLYYDAIRFVKNTPPVIPPDPTAPGIPIPEVPFDFPNQFLFDYDAFFRNEELEELYGLLGIFERDEETTEENGAYRAENALDNLFGDRRDSTLEEEEDEEERRRRARGRIEGQVGMTYYVYEPGTNRYSSYRVFGNQMTSFYPLN